MTGTTHQSNPLLGESLTRREREILALLAEGLTGPEIAERLTVGTSSVKSHVQHLYGKLGANSKRQAVSRARALGLLAPAGQAIGPAEPHSTDVILARLVAAQSGPAARHNLPHQLTSFVGRRRELDEGRRRLRRTRLLTLTGPGGSGKTRLALEIAAEGQGDFPHGVWLVELASIAEPALVPPAVAQALDLLVEGGQTAQRVLNEHLRDKSLLLILDNCEHLVAACAELAERLLQAAPGLRLLATSREPLGVAGENSYPVPALTVPDAGQRATPDTLVQSEAVRLFVERAAAVRPDFALTEGNAAAVAQICRRLDGIPLALELAAARTRALTAEQIAARLDHRFGLLTGGSRTAPPRQQTLRGAIDWSYELLSDPERALLRRLSAFSGGWSLEAAEYVSRAPEALDLLSQLVSKSLVLAEQRPDQAGRFRMLETIREYAQEKLVEAGETEAAQDRHLAYYVSLAEEAEPELRRHGQVRWVNQLDRENGNLRAALAWAVKTADAESAQRLAGALNYYWWVRRNFAEARGWHEAALQLPTSRATLGPSAWRARALLGAGMQLGAGTQGDDPGTSVSRLEQTLAIYRELGDDVGMAHALFWLGRQRVYVHKDYAGALEKYQQALDLWMAAEDGWGVGICLHLVGQAHEQTGDRARARQLYQRSVDLLRAAGDLWQLTWALNDLARQSWSDGDMAHARRMFEEILAGYEEMSSQPNIIGNLGRLASIAAAQGDYAQARRQAHLIQKTTNSETDPNMLAHLGEVDYLEGHLVEASQLFEAGLAGWREKKGLHGQAWLLARLGCVAYRLGELDQAALLLEESLTVLGPNGSWWIRALDLLTQADVARVRGESGTAVELYARSLRLTTEEIDPPNMPERLEGFAKLAGAAQLPQRAARLFGAAQALRDRIGTPIPPVERADYDRARASASAQLDPAAFSAAWAEGLALTWEQAAALALEP